MDSDDAQLDLDQAPATSSSEVDDLRRQLQEAQDERDRLEEDFRRYRVRSEIIRKQKDTEITKVMDASIKFQQRSIAGDSIAGELQVRDWCNRRQNMRPRL